MNRNVLPVPVDTLRPSYTLLPDGSVRFGLEWRDARWVDVAGTFSDWAPVPMQPRTGAHKIKDVTGKRRE